VPSFAFSIYIKSTQKKIDIQGAHAPGERVKVDTVEKCWKLLVTALASVE
ncbi:hypothetical protein JL991_17565, partial [Acinetobacter baumannii]|nr:hypothetical protein [Acinetobacter baumannii]